MHQPATASSTTTVARELIRALRDLGVRHVFGVPSGGWIDYLDALRATDGIEFVLATHEGGAAFMADVCGRLTGVPGLCFGTFGPGATNLATGVGGALLDRSPVIALTDEMPAEMRGRTTQMGIDHQALFRPITKHTTRIEPGRVRETVFEAAAIALAERPGPVHIGLPSGMSGLAVAESKTLPPADPRTSRASEQAIDAARAAIRASSLPVIALGLSATRANVAPAVMAFAEAHGIPTVLSPMAKGLVPESHPLYAGVVFHALSNIVGETHRGADLVVAVGYDPVEFNFESWLPDAPLVAIDVVPVDVDRSRYKVVADVVGDIASSVAAIARGHYGAKGWDLGALRARRAAMFEKLTPRSNTFGPCAALDVLREVLPRDGIMTCDVGAHTHLIGQKWLTPGPQTQIMTNGWSAMGFGVPSAIAAKLCRPEVPVCAVVGDGGFLMTVGELAVAVRLNLPVVFVVLTDNDLALIRIKQEKRGKPIYGTPIRARGTIGGPSLFGVPVETATTAADFREKLTRAFAHDGPVVIEALVNSREYDDLVLKKDKA